MRKIILVASLFNFMLMADPIQLTTPSPYFSGIGINDTGWLVGQVIGDFEYGVLWNPDGTFNRELYAPSSSDFTFVLDLNDANQVLTWAPGSYLGQETTWWIFSLTDNSWQPFDSIDPPSIWGPIAPRAENASGEHFVNTTVVGPEGAPVDVVLLYLAASADPIAPEVVASTPEPAPYVLLLLPLVWCVLYRGRR